MYEPLNAAQLQELQRLTAAHGELTSQKVFDAARSPSSSLHNLFTWDDTSAATTIRQMWTNWLRK